MMTALPETLDQMRAAARRRLPRGLFEFVDRGTEDETALENNCAAFDRVRLCPRVLRDVSARSTATTLFGRAFGLPLAIAPTGAAGLMCYRGDVALGHAAARAGVPFTMPRCRRSPGPSPGPGGPGRGSSVSSGRHEQAADPLRHLHT